MDYVGFFLLLLSGTFSICSSLSQQYYYVNESATWYDAQTYCRAKHIDLVTIEDYMDVKSVLDGVTSPDPKYLGNFWIGLYRTWHWTTGEPLSNYTFWYPDQPNEGNDYASCVLTTTSGWMDYYCYNINYFFCMDASQTDSNRFILIRIGKNWESARAYCRQYYTDLAVVNSLQEQQILNTYGGNPWIGLTSSQWSNEKFFMYRYWKGWVYYETPKVTKCGVMDMVDNGRWNSFDCTLQYPFMCYSGLPTISQEQYVFVNEPKTWFEAQSYCRTEHTSLVTVFSMEDMVKINAIVDPGYSGSVWIGLQNGTDKKWGWTTGEEPSTLYLNWGVGQPSGPGQCGVSINGTWKNLNCTDSQSFVCSSDTGYVLVNDKKTWKEAQSFCKSTYTNLATIRSPWEQRQLNNLVSDGVFVWIGLFQDSWQWSDQYSVFFRNWAEGQPSSTTSTCVAAVTTNSGQWVTDDCNAQYPFVCFKGQQTLSRDYSFMNIPKNWLDAQLYCRLRFDDMATADTLNDVQSMMNEVGLAYSGSLWVGLQELIASKWVWSLGQNPVNNYFQWEDGRPNGEGKCVLIFNKVWRDVSCGSSFYFLCFSNTSEYVLITTLKTWQDAQTYCRTYYTDLASIRSPSEYKQVIDLVNPGWYIWIGLFQDSWWWSDQWNLHFRNWAYGHPYTGTYDCAAMVTTDSGKWKSDTCTVKYPFMCYGADKLRRKQTLRLKISSSGGIDLNDPLMQQAVLNVIEQKVRELGIDLNATVSWRVLNDGSVFTKETIKDVPVLDNACPYL